LLIAVMVFSTCSAQQRSSQVASPPIKGSVVQGGRSAQNVVNTPADKWQFSGAGPSPDDEDGDDPVEGSGAELEGSGAPPPHLPIISTTVPTFAISSSSSSTTKPPSRHEFGEVIARPKHEPTPTREQIIEDEDEDEDDDLEIEDPIGSVSSTYRPPSFATTTTSTTSTTRPAYQAPQPPYIQTEETPDHFEMLKPGVLAAISGGSVVGILMTILLVMFIVYRMRKKDEGSYSLDEPHQPHNYSYAYQKASTKEFYA